MNIKRNFVNYSINFLLALFMAFNFIYALTTTLSFKFSAGFVFGFTAILLIIYSLISFNNLVLKISTIAIGVLSAFAIVFLLIKVTPDGMMNYLSTFFVWIYDYIFDKGYNNQHFALVLTIVLCISITLFVYIFTSKKFKFFFILVFGLILYVSQFALEYLVSYMSFYLFLFLIIIYYFKHIYTKNLLKETNEYVHPGAFILYITPICGVILALSFIIPSQPKPLEWKWLDTKVNHVYDYFFKAPSFTNFEYFSVSSTGFGNNDGQLGGKVRIDKTPVLKVEAPRPIYLKGSIKDFYTGTSWKETDKKQIAFNTSEYKRFINFNDVLTNNIYSNNEFDINLLKNNPTFQDYIEMLVGMSLMSKENDFLLKYFDRDSINVTFLNLTTKSLFIPNKLYKLDTGAANIITSPNGVLTSSTLLKKNYRYSSDTFTLKANDEKVKALLRKSYKGFYTDMLNSYNSLFTELGDKTMKVATRKATESSPFEIMDRPDFKCIIFSFDQQGGIPQNILDQLKNYNLDSNNIYNSLFHFYQLDGVDLYLVTLNQESTNYWRFIFNSNIEFLNIPNISTNPYLLQLLYNRSNEIYKKYLQLPDSLPKRVKDLAVAVTANQNNQYDKVKAVERYLSTTYPYTLSPKSTPNGRDFVDYFLFDSKKGYCTYYASSMVVMLRSIGIPARYIEGYTVSSSTKKSTPKNQNKTLNTYEVTNKQAHAWVEVYFEGFGWIPFEPTASFGSILNSPSSKPASGQIDSEIYDAMIGRRSRTANSDIGNMPDSTINEAVKTKPNTNFVLLICASILLNLLFFIILFNTLRSILRIRRYKRMKPHDGILAFYKYYVKILALQGLEYVAGETPHQYSERVDKYIFSKPVSFKDITNVFVQARYSPNPLNDTDKKIIFGYYKNFIQKTKENLGVIKYFIFKFLLGKI